MFAKTSSTPEPSFGKEAETVIGASVKVEGNFVCQGSIIVDGEVKGFIQTSETLQVGSRSVIIADIKAANARIAGKIDGNISIDGTLELSESARISGDISAAVLAVSKGAIINGRILMNTNTTPEVDINPEDIEE